MDEKQNNYSYDENQNDQNNYQYGSGQYPQYEEQPSGNRGMAIGALVVGIFAILCCCCNYLSIVLGIVGILLAVFSKPKNGNFEGVAMGGLICSIVGLVLGLILTIVGVVNMNSSGYANYMDTYMEYMEEIMDEM